MWMWGAVTSIPSLTRKGRPRASLRSRPPSGRTWTALRVRSVDKLVEILDLDRLDLVGELEAEHLREERHVRGKGALLVLSLAEAVTFAGERDVRVRNAALPQRIDDHLGLRRRHDLVVQALQQQQRARDRVGMTDRRPVAVL